MLSRIAIKNFVAQRKTAQELFKQGQEAGPPTTRIAAYRQLLQEYPDSDVSPQAQFMVGFINSEELKNYDDAEKAFKTLLARWPKAELAASAQWMIEHMRSEDAPSFINLDADSAQNGPPETPAQEKSGGGKAGTKGKKGAAGKP